MGLYDFREFPRFSELAGFGILIFASKQLQIIFPNTLDDLLRLEMREGQKVVEDVLVLTNSTFQAVNTLVYKLKEMLPYEVTVRG